MGKIAIYIDESGDLGFSDKIGSSKYFIITLLYIECEYKLFKIAVSRTLKNKLNHKKSNSREIYELKGSQTSLKVKEYFFNQLPEDGWKIFSVILNKKRVYQYLTNSHGKKKLYNYLAKFLLERIKFSDNIKQVDLYIDKCKNSVEMKDFNQYLQTYLQGNLPISSQLNIMHEKSENNFGIQAVDLFCWGIARKYSHSDCSWYNLFKDKIQFEEVYLNKKGDPYNV